MPAFRKPTLVTLRRQSPSQAWGFRLGGGVDAGPSGQPFQIQKVTPASLAYLGGLSEGDELVRIGNISLRGLTHDEVQQIILRCSHCIDLFVFRDSGGDVTPRFELVNRPEVFNKVEVYPRFQSAPASPLPNGPSPTFSYNHNTLPNASPNEQFANNSSVEPRQDFNRSPRPFDGNPGTGEANYTNVQSEHNALVMPVITIPGTSARDTRVFGVSRGGSKSPLQTLSRENSVSPLVPHSAVQPSAQPSAQSFGQSFGSQPTTPANMKPVSFFGANDFNNNPTTNGAKRVFGLASLPANKSIAPLSSHGVQPLNNDRKYFGVTLKQRHNSFSCDRHWKEPLPLVNIANTDQLLPSQTKQMQTYINQVPPTEKNLRPSLIGLERRRIRPVWPPPLPNRFHKTGVLLEGRDSPNTKMYNWPPRAQSVDRDFSYGEGAGRFATPPPPSRGGPSPDRGELYDSRVINATKVWPPQSNATPAGASGFHADNNDNYAYNPNGEDLPGVVSSHIPRTYRPPPGTQHLVINDF